MSPTPREGYRLERIDGVLHLVPPMGGRGVFLELDDLRRRLRQGRQLALAKAIGARAGLHVLDATAGLGLDGLTLAALGCRVSSIERDPLLFALLEDAVARVRNAMPVSGAIAVRCGEAADVLAAGEQYDCIYFDPMFPDRNDATLPRRSAQVLAHLLGGGHADDLSVLLVRATECARRRVVVKRRRHDPMVANPDWQILGRSVRFDVYRGVAPDRG